MFAGPFSVVVVIGEEKASVAEICVLGRGGGFVATQKRRESVARGKRVLSLRCVRCVSWKTGCVCGKTCAWL